MSDVYQEINRALRTHYERTPYEMPSTGEFRRFLIGQETRNRKSALRGLHPWSGLFEFGLEWLSHTHIALNETLKSEATQKRHTSQVAYALTGSAVSFGLSLRSLCLLGFDSPARALLRSYVEIILLCLAALHDEELARAYQQAQEDNDIKTFWHTTASPKNLHKRRVQIEEGMAFDAEAIKDLLDFRRQEYEILSQSSHISYPAAWMTVFASQIGFEEPLKPAIWGLATENSQRTIFYASFSTWYFSRLAYDGIIGWDQTGSLLVADKENDWHRRIVMGRDVLGTVFMRHYPASHLTDSTS